LVDLYGDKNPPPIMKDAHIWVKTKSDFNDLVNKLKKENFIVVDSEHHDLHSYLEFIALI